MEQPMSIQQSFDTFIDYAMIVCQNSPNKKLTKQQFHKILSNTPRPPEQTFFRNGITISYPIGYKSIESYRNVLSHEQPGEYYYERNQAIIKLIDLALA